MDFKIGYLSSKHIAPEIHLFKPEDVPPPTNKRVLCLSKYGVLRIDVFNPSFDREWCYLPTTSKNKHNPREEK